jgi:hypothetical protein
LLHTILFCCIGSSIFFYSFDAFRKMLCQCCSSIFFVTRAGFLLWSTHI